jgi:itaconate CoA-transferase
MQHPQFAARNAWREIESPAGRVPALIPPVRIGGVDPVMGAIPELGQHSESILAEFGFDTGTIRQWKNEHLL